MFKKIIFRLLVTRLASHTVTVYFRPCLEPL